MSARWDKRVEGSGDEGGGDGGYEEGFEGAGGGEGELCEEVLVVEI